MKITILAVGKVKEPYLREGIQEFSKRLSKYVQLEILEVEDEKTKEHASPREDEIVKDREGERLLKKIPDRAYVIGLAIDGKKYDSVGFARYLEDLGVKGESHLVFVIGGSLGLSEKVLQRADQKVSFSDMTFPHQMMRLILLEQIYRSFKILHNEKYHK